MKRSPLCSEPSLSGSWVDLFFFFLSLIHTSSGWRKRDKEKSEKHLKECRRRDCDARQYGASPELDCPDCVLKGIRWKWAIFSIRWWAAASTLGRRVRETLKRPQQGGKERRRRRRARFLVRLLTGGRTSIKLAGYTPADLLGTLGLLHGGAAPSFRLFNWMRWSPSSNKRRRRHLCATAAWRTWLAAPVSPVYRRRHCLNCPSFSPIIKRLWGRVDVGGEVVTGAPDRWSPTTLFSPPIGRFAILEPPSTESQVALSFTCGRREKSRRRAISMLIRASRLKRRLPLFLAFLSIPPLWKIAGHSHSHVGKCIEMEPWKERRIGYTDLVETWPSFVTRSVNKFRNQILLPTFFFFFNFNLLQVVCSFFDGST